MSVSVGRQTESTRALNVCEGKSASFALSTVTVPAANVEVGDPEITPDLASMVSPDGRGVPGSTVKAPSWPSVVTLKSDKACPTHPYSESPFQTDEDAEAALRGAKPEISRSAARSEPKRETGFVRNMGSCSQ
jgi:hypothetical protein